MKTLIIAVAIVRKDKYISRKIVFLGIAWIGDKDMLKFFEVLAEFTKVKRSN